MNAQTSLRARAVSSENCSHTYSKDVDDIEFRQKITLLDPVVSRIAFSHQYHRDGSLEHPKHMFKLMGKKIIIQFYSRKVSFSGPIMYSTV